jgi:transposase
VVSLGEKGLATFFRRFAGDDDDPDGPERLAHRVLRVCQDAVDLYAGSEKGPTLHVGYAVLCQEVRRELTFWGLYQREMREIEKAIRSLYREIHPSGHVESIYGVGAHGAPVFVSFIGNPHRFGSLRQWRAFVGLIPETSQSTDTEQKGLHITQAGQDILKKYAYLAAETARRYDPQIAAIYYDQMVKKGNHHTKAVCACATHLLDRILVTLQEDRPYELRDVDGRVVTPEQAQKTIAAKYTIPKEVRERLRKKQEP